MIALIEEENWDVDFYSGCVYNRTRTADEWKKALHGELMEMPRRHLHAERPGAHVQSDAADQEALLRVQDSGGRTDRRCAAWSRPSARPLRASSRPTAFMSACSRKFKDEVRENAEMVHRILAKS